MAPCIAVNQPLEVLVLFIGEVAFRHAVTRTAVDAVDAVLGAEQDHFLVQNAARGVA